MHIRFDLPADPAYPGRVAAVLSSVAHRKYGYVGAVLAVLGAIGLALSQGFDRGDQISPLYIAMIVGGVLAMVYGPLVRWRARRRSSGYAVDGSYDITDENIMMRSGTESSGIAWDGVARVTENREFWIVYVGRMAATVIPRERMSEADDATLRAFLTERGLLERR
ncbi:YcxB-like protein [Asanoa hainanensis]|uniref:YcxB-like protein n=1 Tax=Asanoa hainanensis TaxID=560556 RepID=A0A239P904_9ACTN|nr:YcxB family protein [Asanoa hainanensis]SNT63596.1 YcxB-like protein [Asanoa hainanensis]